jgi:sugar/nucleoside kinase (ribokinase family)
VSAKAERLDVEHVPFDWLDTQILLAAPVLDEVDPTILGRFRRSLVGAVGQGWLRRWSGAADTPLGRGDLSSIEAIPPVGALLVSDEDFEGALSDLPEVLEGLTPIAVVTHGVAGADLFWSGEWRPVPAFRAREADPTGAGDVFAAAFLVRLSETRDPVGAARFASAAASLSVEATGPLESAPSREAIERRIEVGER